MAALRRHAQALVDRRQVFRREGNFWTVAWDDVVVRLKDNRGLQYLAQLLARPGQEVHVLDLVAAVHAEPGQAAAPAPGVHRCGHGPRRDGPRGLSAAPGRPA